jgi:hypothetical protein
MMRPDEPLHERIRLDFPHLLAAQYFPRRQGNDQASVRRRSRFRLLFLLLGCQREWQLCAISVLFGNRSRCSPGGVLILQCLDRVQRLLPLRRRELIDHAHLLGAGLYLRNGDARQNSRQSDYRRYYQPNQPCQNVDHWMKPLTSLELVLDAESSSLLYPSPMSKRPMEVSRLWVS